ncbi:hypothetical protein K491DRAFT_699801 [Lophiostoma macrostomum CBS 122681]|uniref:SnoaL-like domain-containing protein n=1 Tax=Lophiostoma macrostomum CBS 122681 TaxID=1314788 RepID=A0A6A6SIG2_9PLEO|nr:hypothetical protein K491DRAFT_699801 [Lophiostoma macrostomum CBS 122681]
MAPLSWIPLALLASIPLSFACDSATLSSFSRSYTETIESGDIRTILGDLISKVDNAPYTIAPYTQDGVDRPISGYRAVFNQGAREILNSTSAINLDGCFTDVHIIATNGAQGNIDIQTKIVHDSKYLTVLSLETNTTTI